MSPTPDKDELEGTEAPFVSHLIEVRDRKIRALIPVGIGFAGLVVWPAPARLPGRHHAPVRQKPEAVGGYGRDR